jgi:type IV pilus assembly protein PilP
MLFGCETHMHDLHEFTSQPQQGQPITIEPVPTFTRPETASYTVAHLRSPFASISIAQPHEQQRVNANCLTPDYTRQPMPLEQYGLDAMQLQGTLATAKQKYAILSTNDGRIHTVNVGDYIGLFQGKITTITARAITLQQLIPDGAGCFLQQQTTLSIGQAAQEQVHV